MCGRFVRKTTALEISDIFSVSLDTDELPISFNVAPTSRVLAIVNSTGGPSVVSFSWGLVPRWAPDASRAASLINARIETVAEKPSFRDLVAQHRCVIPMDGYFEWKEQLRHDAMKPIKQPYYFSAHSQSRYSHQGVLAVAGLWTAWKDPNQSGGQVVHTAVALTTDANDMVSQVHHRMPVLLDRSGVANWLDDKNINPLAQIQVVDNDALLVCAVSTKVNSSRNNGNDLIEPVDLTQTESLGELKLF
jgi:putative SOS response-associated peptidase YedK